MVQADPEIDIAYTISFLVVFIVIPVVSSLLMVVIVRWIFRVNKQVELLTQIKDELRELRLCKYTKGTGEEE